MRQIISWEGEKKHSEIFIEKGALEWGDDPIPMVWNYDFQRKPLGLASDLRREPDGSVTAEVDINDTEDGKHAGPLLVLGELACAMYATGVTRTRVDGVQNIQKATVRAVAVVLRDHVEW